MKETDLNLFLPQLGQALTNLNDCTKVGIKAFSIFNELFVSQLALSAFLKETEDYARSLKDSRESVKILLDTVSAIMGSVQLDMEKLLNQPEVSTIFNAEVGVR